MKNNHMKAKTILLLFSALLLQQISAQDYNPTAVEGAHWIIRFDEMDTFQPVDDLWEYYASGDTTIDNYTYKKIYKRDLVVTQNGPPFEAEAPYELFGFMRDDTVAKKVYAIQYESENQCPENEEYLLFDFSGNVDDTLNLCIQPTFSDFVIQNIHVWDIFGISTRCFEGTAVLYEGIGSDYGLFEEMFAPFKGQSRYVWSTFLEDYCRQSPCDLLVSNNDIAVSQEISIYPNPASNILFIEGSNMPERKSISIYNTLARKQIKINTNQNQVDISALEDGLYIVEVELDGEKFRQKFIKK